MDVYIHPKVQGLRNFYGDLYTHPEQFQTIFQHLNSLSEKLFEGIKSQNLVIIPQINNYNKSYLSKNAEFLFNAQLGIDDAKATIAMEHGFKNWEQMKNILTDQPYNFAFESAISLLLSGKHSALKSLLYDQPSLIHEQSKYGHSASLIHYLGSNGMELWRQVVPLNLAKMTKLLLETGADKNALMNVYGGKFNVRNLLETSAHPVAAGILDEVLPLLV